VIVAWYIHHGAIMRSKGHSYLGQWKSLHPVASWTSDRR